MLQTLLYETMIVPGPQPPPYSPYSNQLPPVRRTATATSRNALWRSWGFPAVGLGAVLLLLGIAMLPVEVTRILKGSLNKGDKGSYLLYPNYNVDRNGADAQIQLFNPDLLGGKDSISRLDNKGIVPFSATANPASQANNFPIQDKYLWPWSHAALLFMLVTVAAGGLGILSGYRRTYSSVFAFFVLSFLSAMLSIFLIAYYSTEVYWQLYKNNNRKDAFAASSIDYSLGSCMLALSCATCLLSFIATIFSGLSLALCCGSKASLKTYSAVPTRDQFVAIKPPPRIVQLPYMPTQVRQ